MPMESQVKFCSPKKKHFWSKTVLQHSPKQLKSLGSCSQLKKINKINWEKKRKQNGSIQVISLSLQKPLDPKFI